MTTMHVWIGSIGKSFGIGTIWQFLKNLGYNIARIHVLIKEEFKEERERERESSKRSERFKDLLWFLSKTALFQFFLKALGQAESRTYLWCINTSFPQKIKKQKKKPVEHIDKQTCTKFVLNPLLEQNGMSLLPSYQRLLPSSQQKTLASLKYQAAIHEPTRSCQCPLGLMSWTSEPLR